MKKIVYLGLLLTGVPDLANAAGAAVESSAAARPAPMSRLDLQPPSLLALAGPVFPNLGSPVHHDIASMLPGERPASPGTPPRGAIVWTLPSGMWLLASNAFTAKSLFNQAAWPTGGSVPAAKTMAGIGVAVAQGAADPLRLTLAVTRTWQLDAPLGGTYLDCTVRLEMARAAVPSIALQVPCGAEGHFGIAVRGRF